MVWSHMFDGFLPCMIACSGSSTCGFGGIGTTFAAAVWKPSTLPDTAFWPVLMVLPALSRLSASGARPFSACSAACPLQACCVPSTTRYTS